MAEDSELWDVIYYGPFVPMKTIDEATVTVPKTRKMYNDDEYNRISSCQSAKEIWEALQLAHEGTTQVKKSKIDMLTTKYELCRMKDDESIQDMHTRFTSIINEIHSLGEIIPRKKIVRKILSVLPSSWESKVNATIEAKDLQNESGEDDEQGYTSMMVVESETAEYDSIFALMAKWTMIKMMMLMSMCAELERNRQLQEDLGRVKNDLEKSLKWTWSSDAITAMYKNNEGNINIEHFKETCKARFQSQQKNKVFAEKGAVKGINQRWYMDSDCSNHMTGSADDFLSLKVLQGGSVSFSNGKKGYILGVGRVGKTLTHSFN
ncbi:uncharacterized protein LOC142168296 [Nicotiana tabacum]|uniref:Uncharacterized protein LOC142168296 n=1 Tax=Nicotiana tabacum TaxID=4097 RepID=A0AC58SJC8_TOBAC